MYITTPFLTCVTKYSGVFRLSANLQRSLRLENDFERITPTPSNLARGYEAGAVGLDESFRKNRNSYFRGYAYEAEAMGLGKSLKKNGLSQ